MTKLIDIFIYPHLRLVHTCPYRLINIVFYMEINLENFPSAVDPDAHGLSYTGRESGS